MKTCTKCGEVKDLAEFRKRQGKCAPCQDVDAKIYYLQHREQVLARLKTPEQRAIQRIRDKERYGPERREAARLSSQKYRDAHPDRRKATNAKWYLNPTSKKSGALSTARRRARLAKATPPWADHGKIAFFYASMSYLRAEGLDIHVDHVVPLQGRTVRGLHVHNNLRLMFASLNHQKSNKLITE